MTTHDVQQKEGSTPSLSAPPSDDGIQTAARGIKLVAELAVPGASLLADGRLAEGGLHLAAGVAARMLFGPIGFVLVAANSYTRSVTGKSIHQHLGKSIAGAKGH